MPARAASLPSRPPEKFASSEGASGAAARLRRMRKLAAGRRSAGQNSHLFAVGGWCRRRLRRIRGGKASQEIKPVAFAGRTGIVRQAKDRRRKGPWRHRPAADDPEHRSGFWRRRRLTRIRRRNAWKGEANPPQPRIGVSARRALRIVRSVTESRFVGRRIWSSSARRQRARRQCCLRRRDQAIPDELCKDRHGAFRGDIRLKRRCCRRYCSYRS
jgi:hypothetical protein